MPQIELDDGSPLYYEVKGTGPPVLLIQGVSVPAVGWRPQVDGLAAGYRLAAYDNRGLGRSVPRRGKLTIERMARDGLAVLDSIGADSAHVAGHSMGGVIAQALALRRYDASHRLAELASIPMLVVSADEDPISPPRCGEAIAAAIAGARLETFEGSAHGVTLHRIDEINALLAEHFAAADAGAAAPTVRGRDPRAERDVPLVESGR